MYLIIDILNSDEIDICDIRALNPEFELFAPYSGRL